MGHIFNFLFDYCQFFSLFCRDSYKTGSNCAIISWNLLRKDKLALHKTQAREPNYVDHKFFFNVALEATCAKTWVQRSKYKSAG